LRTGSQTCYWSLFAIHARENIYLVSRRFKQAIFERENFEYSVREANSEVLATVSQLQTRGDIFFAYLFSQILLQVHVEAMDEPRLLVESVDDLSNLVKLK
jgi:hypothetical protein